MNKKKRTPKRTSLKWKLISTMLLYWVLPFIIIISTIGAYSLQIQETSQMERLVSQTKSNMETSRERLEGAIADSRQATYDRVLYEKYREYKWGNINERAFYNNAQLYLDGQYSHKEHNTIAVLMLLEDPVNKKYTSYNFSAGGRFSQIQTLLRDDREKILDTAKELGTAVGFVKCGERIYIVRNMVDKSFTPWGVLVNRINKEYCFGTLLNYGEEFRVRISLNGQPLISTGEKREWENLPETDFKKEQHYILHKDRAYAFGKVKNSDFEMEFILNARKKDLFTTLYGYKFVVSLMLLLMLPMLLIFLRLSRKYLSDPVERMMACAEEIRDGNLGYQMEGDTGSLEFEYLRESFNEMSGRLKYQFDHIYEEELALRDAKIMALQSHINPHFMNNTLEIINWEARLSGSEKVSKMIEALSTLMDAAIDRRKLPEVRLSEEMIYVNAYLYITSERLGKRLKIVKELPEEIMGIPVPRLIMQPIIENAIEHGIVPGGGGTVCIRGRQEGKYLYLDIINDGEFLPEDEERVKRLLSPDYDTSRESSGSMGIANVNQRLRIICGEECGLSIKRYGDAQTISTLTILVHS